MDNMAKLIFLKSALPDLADVTDDTQVWLWFPEGEPIWFHNQLNEMKEQGLLIRNLVYVAKKPNGNLSYDVLVFLTRSMDYHFYKDSIRVKSRWRNHEFGNGKVRKNGKRPYHDKGKDPSNVWLKELTENGSPHVIGLDGISKDEMFRRILFVSTKEGDPVATNSEDFLRFAEEKKRVVQTVSGIPIRHDDMVSMQMECDWEPVQLSPLNKTYIHDSRVPMKELATHVDLIVTSPPYYRQRDYGHPEQIGQEASHEEYLENLRQVWINCFHYLKPGGYFVLNINNFMMNRSIQLTHWNMIQILMEIGFKYHDTLIWFQPNSRRGLNAKNVCDAKEYIIIVLKEGEQKELGDRIVRFPQLRGSLLPNGVTLHPAMFPIELAEYFIDLLCPMDGVVLDPFMGSGKVASAAEKLGRKWVGFELNENYVKLSKKETNEA